jgi:hypothetical protein
MTSPAALHRMEASRRPRIYSSILDPATRGDTTTMTQYVLSNILTLALNLGQLNCIQIASTIANTIKRPRHAYLDFRLCAPHS